jgi:myosin-5
LLTCQVALNPFSPIPLCESKARDQANVSDTNDILHAYVGKKKGELEPHLFAIAEEALDYMRRGSGGGGVDPTGAGDQTIVVSGER